MSSQDTRNKLIGIIKQHQLDNGMSKLPVGKLSELSGITRQAFNRYYGDLKEYATGKQSIARLLVDDSASLSEMLENREEKIAQLKQELIKASIAHKEELEKAIEHHITSLMNNDIMVYESGQISSTLINQNNHNAYLSKRVTELEVRNAKMVADAVSAPTSTGSNYTTNSAKNFIALELDLKAARKAYASSNDFSAYEDAKDTEIQKAIKTVNSLPDSQNADVVIFQERYISDFNLFCKKIYPRESHTLVALQLPLYSREEIQLVVKEIRPINSISIHIPYSSSDAVISAKRQFSFRDVPAEELQDADTAKTPLMDWGFDSIQITRIKQGD
ncbi:hypothetical protein ACIOVF_20440 [Pseudomonas sp. NPDC087612]|uniref:hypothetical protein n=1 Tax=Pseudomonas sp. NPDC087612 TaxID=3364441 RepID=UPI0038022258